MQQGTAARHRAASKGSLALPQHAAAAAALPSVPIQCIPPPLHPPASAASYG